MTLLWSNMIAARVYMVGPSEQIVRGVGEKLLEAILFLQFQESGEVSLLDPNQHLWSNSPSHNLGREVSHIAQGWCVQMRPQNASVSVSLYAALKR
jgi:hypothetical protein